ncbi:hypothetical protein [Arthrobacter sp. Soil782]|uniref:hypothetical protein n=1 Tax=Arthrobacter sp. Soil782 TaxID=1736410 RepID=UPI000A4B15F7|nr:hypothetical protein [Arthrobacter sp. Soil782]
MTSRHAARRRSGRERDEEAVRIMAARLRTTTDRKLGKKTPDWVIELAARPIPAPENVDETVRVLAARLRVTTDRKLGKRTPDWVKELAATRL